MPIQQKLMFISMLTTCAALLLACAAFVSFEQAHNREELRNYYVSHARFIGKTSITALIAQNPKVIEDLMGSLDADPKIIAACIYDVRGSVFATYVQRGEAGFQFPAVPLEGQWIEGGRVEVFRKIVFSNEIIGTVYLVAQADDLGVRLWRYAGITLIVLLAAAGLAFIISTRLHPMISRPILNLAKTANEVAANSNYSVRAVKETEDELGHLVGSFNWMLTQIQARDEELQKARDGLEQRVAERMMALSQANEMLRRENQERQKAEEALRNSQQKLLLHIRQTPLGAIDWNLQFEAINWNPAAEKIFGLSEAEAIGCHACDTIVPENVHGQVGAVWRDLIEGRGGRHSINQNRTKDGRIIICEWFNTPLINRDDRVVGVASLVQDITLRVEAETALRQSEERFSKAFRASPMALGITTMEIGRFVDVNESFLALFGYRAEEMIGHTATELGLWGNTQDLPQLLKRLKDNSRVKDVSCRFRRKGGEVRSTLTSVERIDLGNEPCLLYIVHDITERLSLEEQLRQAQKMEAVGQLAAGVAHDFNNILTIVQGHTALLLAKPITQPGLREALQQVEGASERAANLVRQLLAFSRRQIMQPRALDLNELVQNLSRMLTRILGEDITLHLECDAEAPAISADPGMVEQVILNLAVNARDAMVNGGQLTINTRMVTTTEVDRQHNPDAQLGEFVCLTVTDTGSGMDPAIMKRIFEPFFTTKPVGKGTGLGLSMVYGIVKQHEGWVEVESQVGVGTSFRIHLPCAPRASLEVNHHVPPPVAVATLTGHETILVVEDEGALRELVRNILQYYGYRVVEAGTGQAALNLWEKEGGGIDLLLTDMVMPQGMTGRDLAERLLALKPDLKVIYSSGYSLELVARNFSLREGVNFLAKPYHPATLIQAVRDTLDGRIRPLVLNVDDIKPV